MDAGGKAQCAVDNHDFTTVTKTWQTVDLNRYQVLSHSKQVLVCMRCGLTIDPWINEKAA